jgi:hypothetical protein
VIGLLLVAQLGIVARAPDTAAACVPFELSVAVRAPGVGAPRIDPPSSTALQLLRSRLATRVERDALGRPTTLTEGSFLVALGAGGRVTLPPFVASAAGATARSQSMVVDVRSVASLPPAVLVRSALDRGAGAHGDTVWVGQQVDYVVDVQLNETARQRLRHNPTFYPPEMPAVLAYDLAPPPPLVREGRQCFETLSHRRALFPLFAGAVRIAPATLTYSLPLSSSFFAREERFELRTDTVSFVAADPPPTGRPASFTGAVGTLQASTRLDASTARMGDPLVLTMRITGAGNVKLLPRPTLSIDWATVAIGEERVRVDTSRARVRGEKEFDWLLTPRRAGRLSVPAIDYVFFDPVRAEYDVARSAAIPIEIAAASLASGDTASTTRMPIRRTLGGERGAPLPARPWFWALMLLAPAPATLRRLLVRRRRRASRQSAERRLRALGAAGRPPTPRELRRGFLDALRERVPEVAASAAPRVPLGRLLRRAGVTDATAGAVELLVEQLDRAAFSASGVVDPGLAARAIEIAGAVDREAIRRASGGPTLTLIVVVSALCAAGAWAVPDAVRRTFDDGVRAYERGEYAAAQRLFARSAARVPRAGDAWANVGASAWARADTAHAVMGWQRALRLDPLDEESRERLTLVHPVLIGAPSYVPPLPVDALAIAALALWIGAWIALAVQASRRTPHLRPVAGGGLALAIAALAGALELQDRASVRGLGVLRHTRDLLNAPSADAQPAAAASAGEVGTLGVREGSWVRLALDGSRAGWIPAAAVLPLDAAAPD